MNWWNHLNIAETEWREKCDRMNAARADAFNRDFTRNIFWLFVILAVITGIKL